MNITGIHQASGTSPAAQPKQDSHEINIQKQIVSLQEKVRGIAYDNEMSGEEKSDEKKALQEKIQNLNSELKQYQAQKRQEEAKKRQQEAVKRQEEEARKEKNETVKTDNASAPSSAQTSSMAEESTQSSQQGDASSNTGNAGVNAMFSASNTKEHLSNMQKIMTSLEGQLRTASTEEEKASLQKKINNVSKSMGKKIQKISDTITDAQNEEKARKEKVQKQLQEYRDRRSNMSASVPRSDKAGSTGSGYRIDNSETPGKVFLTRKRP